MIKIGLVTVMLLCPGVMPAQGQFNIQGQAPRMGSVTGRLKPASAPVAVLLSTTAMRWARGGSDIFTADQSTVFELLYRSHTPFELVTEEMVRRGGLKDYRLLVAVGPMTLPDDVLETIHKFTTDNGGHVFANARFSTTDDHAQTRKDYPPSWLGVRIKGFHRPPRRKTETRELSRAPQSSTNQAVDPKGKRDAWSCKSIRLADGTVLGSGNIHGCADPGGEDPCHSRHEPCWEDLDVLPDGKVIGSFEDGRPAVVETLQTMYVARDICGVDENFERFFRKFLQRCGVDNPNAVVVKGTAEPATSVDLRVWQGEDEKVLCVVTNSVPTLRYDGKPVDVEVIFDACGAITDAVTGQTVPSRWQDFKRVIPLTLKAGETRVLAGKPYVSGREGVQARYHEVIKYHQPNPKPYVTYRRSADQLWIYDSRTELGIGDHVIREDQLEKVQQLGIRLVRNTLYWPWVERTEKWGMYDQETLANYDQSVERARKKGTELLFVVHGDPPGVSWENRHQSYERFARFMEFLVKRYPSVRYWELWNEMEELFTTLFGAKRPNFPHFERGRCYAQMLKVVYPVIKRANPRAWVLVGGLYYRWPTDFLRGLYEEGGREYFDFMNIHTYGLPLKLGLVVNAYAVRATMGQYGDADRPLWNTEFGVDAGQLWKAWGFSTPQQFDQGQRDQLREGITDALQYRLYWKILPFQYKGKNEHANDILNDPKTGISLPVGHTIDDYGFGIVRRDWLTPRPAYHWLRQAQVNMPIEKEPVFTADVELEWDGSWKPKGYRVKMSGNKITIYKVKIDSLEPTVILLDPIEQK